MLNYTIALKNNNVCIYNFCSYLTTCIIDWGRTNELFVNLNHELTKNHINHDFTKYQVNPNCNYFKTLNSRYAIIPG